ncbi:MAG: ankyrin repeat domain-containing protein [Armatimonadetes bacterium]|nr:ankyrin repeat domain-containing protein [Armatimonadota bacterium]
MGRILLASMLLVLFSGPLKADAIHEAAEEGRLELVQSLISEDPAALARPDAQGYLPLHLAARSGQAAVVEFLLGQGADPNARTRTSWTPLHEASAHGHPEVIRLLLAHRAVVEIKETQNGGTALHVAAFNGHLPAVELLLRAGAKVNARDKDGWTPLSQARDQGHQKVIDLLLKHGGKR